ncbi:MAG TPA: SDR family NAD(P)-dependent oxidoreductase, partial [Allocoleopsis sp.]
MTSEKTALVTGANKGIGLEIVRQLAKAGFRVFLTARSRQRGEETVRKLQEDGLNVEFLQLDVTDETSIEQL